MFFLGSGQGFGSGFSSGFTASADGHSQQPGPGPWLGVGTLALALGPKSPRLRLRCGSALGFRVSECLVVRDKLVRSGQSTKETGGGVFLVRGFIRGCWGSLGCRTGAGGLIKDITG